MKKKFSFMTIAAVCFSLLLGGCGKKMTTEDAPVYVQAVLDSRYKADYSAYMDYKKCTEFEAQQIHEQGLNSIMTSIGVADTSVSTELKDQFLQLFEGLNSISKYTVGAAEEDGKGFTVDVTAQPFAMFGEVSQGMVDAINTEEAAELTTDEQIHQFIYQEMYRLMSAKMASPEYGNPQTVTLHIQPDDNKNQTISEEDLSALDSIIYGSIL